MEYQYDLIVIGAGSGGVRAARMAAAEGKKVAVIENRYLGGTCVNVGCVPKKLFVYASEYSEKAEEAKGFGLNVDVKGFEWNTLRNNKDNEISRLNGIYNNLLEGSGAEIFNGTGSFVDKNTVAISNKETGAKEEITGERILIATGGWPVRPNIPGAEHTIDSNQVFHMEQFPTSVVVIGGGYIAVEFAGIFNGLGAETTLSFRSDNILRGFDEEVRKFAQQQIESKDIKTKPNSHINEIRLLDSGQKECIFEDGSVIVADEVMYAIGRRPMTDGLNLDGVGVEVRTNGMIVTNETFQTSIENIYAVGDIIGTPALTPVALEQGMQLVNHLYKGQDIDIDYTTIATAVFCQPNIATIGPTEEEAIRESEAHGWQLDVYQSEFRALKHTISGLPERTLMKLLVNKDTDKVIAAHMVGPDAGEIMQGLGIAIKAGVTKKQFDSTIGIHPTAAEEFVTMRSPRS